MPDDVYVGNFGNYAGAFGGVAGPPSGALPPSPDMNRYAASFGAQTDRELRSSTSALKDAVDTARSALGQITSAVSSAVNTMKGIYSSVASAVSPSGFQAAQRAQFSGMPSSEVGRYVGSASYLESAKGSFGYGGSPFMMRGDYQQIMSNDFARRTTLLGSSIGGVATEMGAGYAGSKILGPMISKGLFGTVAGGMLGYMGGGYAASHVMGRINQGLEFDGLIKDVSARSGIDEGGREPGFNASNRRKIAKGLRKGDLGLGDYADVMLYGSEAGLFKGAANPDEFVDTVKGAAKQVKALMKILRETDVRDVMEDMATFKQWGIPINEQASFAMHLKSVGRSLGLTAKGAMQMVAPDAQAAIQMGYSGRVGAEIGMRGGVIGNTLLRQKIVSEEDMGAYGGAEEYGKAVSWTLARRVETPFGKMTAAAMTKKNEKGEYVFDEEMYKKYREGKIDEEGLQSVAADKLRDDVALRDMAINRPQKFLGIIGTDNWNRLMGTKYKGLVQQGAETGYTKEESEMRASMGLTDSSEEAKMLRSYSEVEPAAEVVDTRARENAKIDEAREAARSKRGWFGRQWDKTVGYAYGKMEEGIGDYIVDPVVGAKESLKNLGDTTYDQRYLGIHPTKLPEQDLPKNFAVEKLSSESQRRVDERVGEIQKRAGASGDKVVDAVVRADELKEDIKSFGAEKNIWGQGVGDKLLRAGAYENVGSLGLALTAKDEEGLGRLGKQAGFSDDESKKMREFYDLVKKESMESRKELAALIQKGMGSIKSAGVGGPGTALIPQQSDIPVDTTSPKNTGHIWDEYKGKFVTAAETEGAGGGLVEKQWGHTAESKEQGSVLGEQEYSAQVKGQMAFEDGSEVKPSSRKGWWSSLGIVPEKTIREEGMPAPEGGYAFMREEEKGSLAGEYAPVPMSEEEYSRQQFSINDPSLAVKESKKVQKKDERQRKQTGIDMSGTPVYSDEADNYGPRATGSARLDEHFDVESWRKKWSVASEGVSVGAGGGVGPLDGRDKWKDDLKGSPLGSVGWSLANNVSLDTPKSAGVPRSINAGASDGQADGGDTKKSDGSAKKASKALDDTADSANNFKKTLNDLAGTIKMVFNKSVSSNSARRY